MYSFLYPVVSPVSTLLMPLRFERGSSFIGCFFHCHLSICSDVRQFAEYRPLPYCGDDACKPLICLSVLHSRLGPVLTPGTYEKYTKSTTWTEKTPNTPR